MKYAWIDFSRAHRHREGHPAGGADRHAARQEEGETLLLERLLARRFGPLSNETRAFLDSATVEQLEQWAENILDADSLEAVFASH